VGRLLAEKAGGDFLDTDDFHSADNKAKMAAGIALTDEDRWGWLDLINAQLKRHAEVPGITFLACSALRACYRERMTEGIGRIVYVHLQGSMEEIRRRLSKRTGHFMSPALLESQFETLEQPAEAITVSIEQLVENVVEEIHGKIFRDAGNFKD